MAPSTYSIVACDLDASQWGVAVQSKFLAVGSLVTWAEPHVGALATQAHANPRYGPDGLALLRRGCSASEAVERLTASDEGRDHRQVGVVDRRGRSATYTGSECYDWAGGRTGPCYAAQGNILVSAATVDALAETFEAGAEKALAPRLVDCLAAAQAAGGRAGLGRRSGRRGPAAPAARRRPPNRDPRAPRRPGLRDQRLQRRRRPDRHRRARRGAGARGGAPGALRRPRRPRDLHRQREGGRRAAGHARLRRRPRHAPRRRRARGRHDDSRGRRAGR